ncbi:hypothetical protein CBR_g23733 [Chara braunii]|uniref:F-box domain-containing protein n=1 Tax=Chara braunii TaxID=69332 RepID=A0A388JVJ0_CHABU|nr:hypothetical protein CBR_g23733 [Chara braunii]|eukprot:GBG61773.1 hypothetical protein CBR_g23733 [Chara braunii]
METGSPKDYLSFLPEPILRYILEIASNGRTKRLLHYASVCTRFLQAVYRVPKLKIELNRWEINIRDSLVKPVLRTTDLQSLTIVCNSWKCLENVDALKLCLEHARESLTEFLFDVTTTREEGNVRGYSFEIMDYALANCRRLKTLRLNPWMNVGVQDLAVFASYHRPLMLLEHLVMGNAQLDADDGDLGPLLQLFPRLRSLTIDVHRLTTQVIVRSSSLKTVVISPCLNRDHYRPAHRTVGEVIIDAPRLEHMTLRHVSRFTLLEGTCPREVILDNSVRGLNLSPDVLWKPVDMAILATLSGKPSGKSPCTGACVNDMTNLLVMHRSRLRRLGIDVQVERDARPTEARLFLDAFLRPFPTLTSLEIRGEVIPWLQDYVGECGLTKAFLQAPQLEELKIWVKYCSPRTVQLIRSFLGNCRNVKTLTVMLFRFPVKCAPAWGFLTEWVTLEKEQIDDSEHLLCGGEDVSGVRNATGERSGGGGGVFFVACSRLHCYGKLLMAYRLHPHRRCVPHRRQLLLISVHDL